MIQELPVELAALTDPLPEVFTSGYRPAPHINVATHLADRVDGRSDREMFKLVKASGRFLRSLPFIGNIISEYFWKSSHTNRFTGPFQFPTARMIGTPAFMSWAGRDAEHRSDERSILCDSWRPDLDGRSAVPTRMQSLASIVNYAHVPLEVMGSDAYEQWTDVVVFRDAAGQLWGANVHGGSHRMGAAKLRRDPAITVQRVVYSEPIGVVPFSVVDRFATRRQRRWSWAHLR